MAVKPKSVNKPDDKIHSEQDNLSHLTKAITKRKKVEDKLRLEEQRFRAFVEHSSDIIVILNLEGLITYINPAVEKVLGFKPEERIGARGFELAHPDDMKFLADSFNILTRETNPHVVQGEMRLRHKDGSWRTLEAVGSNLAHDNVVEAIIVNYRDITGRKQAESQRAAALEALRQSEERYRTILENMQEGYFEVDLTGNFIFCNDSLSRIHKRSKDEMMGMNNRQYMDKEDAKKVFEAFNRVYKTGEPLPEINWQITRKDGVTRYIEASVSLLKDSSAKPIGFRGITHDITERKKAESQREAMLEVIRQGEEKYRNILESIQEGYFEVDLNGNFTFCNNSMSRLTGYSKEEMLGMSHKQFTNEETAKEVFQAFNKVYTTGEPSKAFDWQFMRKDGVEGFIETSITLQKDSSGKPTGFKGMIRDINERKRTEQQINYMATHDTLTGLPNRLMFSQLLNQAIRSAQRHKRQLAVFFIDLDRFKSINDSLGHEAGDRMLKEMARRFKKSLRADDVIGRLGGDEFVILTEEVDELSQISSIAHKILSSTIKPIVLQGEECRITASIGISIYPGNGTDEQSLIKNADMAMYFAKEEGRNNYQFYSKDIQSLSNKRFSIETNLRRALERNELSLEYQAKVDFKTGRITGVEALLRWENPSLGSITPTQFIPVAEETGLIVPIGRWVMKTACAQNVAWQRQGLPPVCMAVNLSLRQLMDDNLLEDIKAALDESGMAPNLLELEITESMVMQNPAHMIAVLTDIKKMGVRLAIDDFGTGYSSLAQLKHFPIDTLKVDRSFIRNLPQDSDNQAIIEAVIAMGKTLKLTVVAEGVETQEQEDFLRNLICDEMQGFYFSKPVAPDQFADLLRNHDPSSKRN